MNHHCTAIAMTARRGELLRSAASAGNTGARQSVEKLPTGPAIATAAHP